MYFRTFLTLNLAVSASVDEVDGDGRSDGVGGVAGCRKEPNTQEHAEIGLPAVFNGRREPPPVTASGIERNAGWALYVRAAHAGVAGVPVCNVGGENPTAIDAVFPGIIDIKRASWPGGAAESGGRAVDARILNVHLAGKRIGDVEARTNDAAIGQPEVHL